MRRKSHYTILGIPRGESREGVRAAYLRRVKEFHPDHAGESGAEAFREVQQAYDVLSDPLKRRSYDSQLDRKRPARRWRAEPMTRRRTVEPLIPDQTLGSPFRTNRSTLVEDLFRRDFADLTPIESSPEPSPEVIGLDVTVSAEQAERGGEFRIGIPTRESCRACSGTGYSWPFSCVACNQKGWVQGERVLHMRIPPGVGHGTVVHLQLEGTGGVVVRLRLLIDERMRAPPIW